MSFWLAFGLPLICSCDWFSILRFMYFKAISWKRLSSSICERLYSRQFLWGVFFSIGSGSCFSLKGVVKHVPQSRQNQVMYLSFVFLLRLLKPYVSSWERQFGQLISFLVIIVGDCPSSQLFSSLLKELGERQSLWQKSNIYRLHMKHANTGLVNVYKTNYFHPSFAKSIYLYIFNM